MAKHLLHALGLSFGGQPQDHHKNECDSGQQSDFETDGMSLQA